ncbi:MAG: NADH-ubiquinone oxidoreductase-F iron-sulfur binding region domain-containing protein [Myxococcota bacterium]
MSHELLERARRLASVHDDASVLDDLEAGLEPGVVAARRGLPLARVLGVQSFYDLLAPTGDARLAAARLPHVCVGTACWSARAAAGVPLPSAAEAAPVRCLGRCYEAPADTTAVIDRARHPITVRSLIDPPIVFRHLFGPPPNLAELYACPDPDHALARIEVSGLRGRGGAAYPTAAKWRAARRAPGAAKVVIANGDEGDPGSYVDRLLLERAPHAVLAGMNLCAHVIGANEGIVFIRGEYPEAAACVRQAIAEAEPHLTPGFRVSVRIGAGSYVCGEETALIRAIEGLRAEAQPKPPYPAERGLHGRPTVVQNVETLALVPWVVESGLAPTSKAFSISGAVAAPAAVEAPLGIPLRDLLVQGAGGPAPGARWSMALVGGPMGRLVAEPDFDVQLGYDTLPGLGHGGVVVLDERVSPRALALHLYEFAAAESCGACAPCRIGTARLAHCTDRHSLERLLATLELGSLCGFGQGVPRPLRDLLRAFPDALFTTLRGRP